MISDRLGKSNLVVVVERRHHVRPPFHICLAEALLIYLPEKSHLAHSRPFRQKNSQEENVPSKSVP